MPLNAWDEARHGFLDEPSDIGIDESELRDFFGDVAAEKALCAKNKRKRKEYLQKMVEQNIPNLRFDGHTLSLRGNRAQVSEADANAILVNFDVSYDDIFPMETPARKRRKLPGKSGVFKPIL